MGAQVNSYSVATLEPLVCDLALFSSGRVVLNQLIATAWASPMFTGLCFVMGWVWLHM